MLKIKNMPAVYGDAIKKEFNIDIFNCEFTQMAENGSYICLNLDDNAIEDLKDAIDWEQGKSSQRLNRLINELNLIEKFRELGYTDEILVFVFW